MLRRSVSYARSLMAELNPPSLNNSGLQEALRWLAGQMSFHDLAVDAQISSDSLSLPKEQAIILYRSVRELLINVSKHARVNRATLTLTIDESNLLSIRVEDQGRGFDTSLRDTKSPGSSYGLASVNERLMTIGGWLKTESLVGQGSKITLYLPLGEVGPESLCAASTGQQDRVTSVPQPLGEANQLPLL